jgi:predicted DNA-binding ribbon-helix-helix protein
VENFGKNDDCAVVALTAEVKDEELKQVVNLSAYILLMVGKLLLQKIQNHINNEP